MTADTKEYIGDGIYAAFDGYMLILTTENGIYVTNRIGIEPRERAKLTKYVDALKSTAELAADALKKNRNDPNLDFCAVNPNCVDGLAPRKTGPDEGDVDMEPCPVCGGPSAV